MKLELVDCTNVLLAEIGNHVFKRKDIAGTYALALRSSEATDWRRVNRAIIKRWSLYGLDWIKCRAWRLIEHVEYGEIG